jgi:non-ribosomal peptide synthetase component F
VDTGTAKFDVMLFVTRTDAGAWRGSLEYRTRGFGVEDGGWLSGCLRTVLRGVSEAPDAPVMGCSLVTESERRGWAGEAEANRVGYPREMTVVARFRGVVAEFPESEAVVCGAERLTYRGLDQRSEGVARRLREMGIAEGSAWRCTWVGRSSSWWRCWGC